MNDFRSKLLPVKMIRSNYDFFSQYFCTFLMKIFSVRALQLFLFEAIFFHFKSMKYDIQFLELGCKAWHLYKGVH